MVKLNKYRNITILKYITERKKILNSLTIDLQINQINFSDNFKKSKGYNRVLILKYLIKYAYSTTEVSASNYKNLLDVAILKSFQFDIKKFNYYFF